MYVSRGDEKLGLDEKQQAIATKLAESGDNPVAPPTHIYREIRNKPLEIHCLKPNGHSRVTEQVAAFGVSLLVTMRQR